ncbi:MAG TPA: archaemetzincin [Pyrinomonadaceae bacterium]|nr:archaemetzincin [Pyrinomonadaceae bacterium]
MRSLALALVLLFSSCQPAIETASNSADAKLAADVAALSSAKEKLVPFFKPMHVEEGDWLESYPENGQTFEQYVNSDPVLPTAERKTIYIQPMGKFTRQQKEVINLTADYMRAFFNLPVELREVLPLKNLPPENIRIQYPDNEQIRTSYFIDGILPKMIPADAAAFICFTNYDLFPGDTWNFVFGQASLRNRVGVWSLWRLEKDDLGKKVSKELLLARTLKIAMHETGHMFSMTHCTKYECLMSGTNHLAETDRRPLDTCPECSAKIAWAMKYPLFDRYKRLAEFWGRQGKRSEQKLMHDKAESICDCRL